MFTIPHRSHFMKSQTSFSPDKSVYLGPLKWPVIAVYKDLHTQTGVSNLVRLHMRLGHYNVAKLKTACELYKTDFKDEMNSSDKLHCCPCNVTKARRIVPSTNPKRKLSNTPTFNHGGDTSANPTEGKLASTVTVFGHLIYMSISLSNSITTIRVRTGPTIHSLGGDETPEAN